MRKSEGSWVLGVGCWELRERGRKEGIEKAADALEFRQSGTMVQSRIDTKRTCARVRGVMQQSSLNPILNRPG